MGQPKQEYLDFVFMLACIWTPLILMMIFGALGGIRSSLFRIANSLEKMCEAEERGSGRVK